MLNTVRWRVETQGKLYINKNARTTLMGYYKEIIESNWSVKKEDDESFVTFEEEFSIQVSDSFRTKTDKLKWINDLISFSKAWTTTKGRPLSQAEVNEMQSILQSLVPTEEY